MPRPRWTRALQECKVKKRKLLASGKVQVWGECDWDTATLSVSTSIYLPAKLKTLLHECLHWTYPKATEEEILKMEEIEWAKIGPTTLRLLLDALYPPRRP